jgi:very-short-patch-repair endonuclease
MAQRMEPRPKLHMIAREMPSSVAKGGVLRVSNNDVYKPLSDVLDTINAWLKEASSGG